jgi:peptide deformylase
MALRDIIQLPDKQLLTVSDPVVRIDNKVRALVADMFDTMYDAPGIGLAAIQIGVPLRIVTMDVSKREDQNELTVQQTVQSHQGTVQVGSSVASFSSFHSITRVTVAGANLTSGPTVFINPEIVWFSDEKSVYEEGCLSIPDIHEDVERPARVRVRYLDMAERLQEIEADGLAATCIQHEVDHLNGVLFIDHISKLKRDRVVKKFNKGAKWATLEKTEQIASRSRLRLSIKSSASP